MTPRKPAGEKLRPGPKPLSPEDRRFPVGYVRLRTEDVDRLDRVAKQGRQAFMTAAVLKAIAAAEKKQARA
jgi:hypothetical protein